MAEMKTLNGHEIVDAKARERLDTLEKEGVGGGGGDVSTDAMQAAITAAIQEHNEQIQVHQTRLAPMAEELMTLKKNVSELTAEKVGADPAGTAATKVSEHDTYTGSHNDIRLLIQGLSGRLDALANSDDTTLDDLKEIVTYIKANKGLIDSITTSKVSVEDIIDNLTTNVNNRPLSAAQGVALKNLIDALGNSKLDASALGAAVDQALLIAKESGEFKGDPYTLTEDDKALIVAQVIQSLGGNPVFGYVDENNNIIVQGSLAAGTYAVKYIMEDGTTVSIGNLILGEAVHYSVTKNLSNCTISSSVNQVMPGGKYNATITPNASYVLSTVNVTMGGVDVTASVYSNGVINISSVTGNIVITASAVKEAAKTYSVTNNLTNCVNSNSATVVEEGAAYNATISPASGYTLDSVTVTMGGNAVTVSDGVINITNVTGNIVITAVAEEVVEEVKNWITNSQNADGSLFVGTNGEAGYKSDTRFGTSDGGERANATGIEATGFIPVTADDTLYFKGVTITTSANETTCWYDSDHNFITGGGSSTRTVFGTMDGTVTSVKISDIKSGAPANNSDKIAYVRISASVIDANSIITKNQPIE